MNGDSERGKMIVRGALVIVLVGAVFSGLLLLRTKLEGVLGDWLTMVMGVLTTPFFMEAFFIIMGFMLVVWINHRHRVKEGDEFVDLSRFEEKDAPDGRKDG